MLEYQAALAVLVHLENSAWIVEHIILGKVRDLEKLIYMRNVDSTFNHERPIEHMVEIELFHKGHKERMEIDVIEGQK